jgi:hypothetical protein
VGLMRKIIITAALAGVGLLAAACGSSSSGQVGQAPINGVGSMPSAAAPALPANPVTIVKQAGAKVPAGEVKGDHDVFGDRMADGSFTHGETITVYTATPDMMSELVSTEGKNIDDGTAMVTGHNFVVMVYAGAQLSDTSADPVYVYPVTAAAIAQRVHGQVQQG